MICKNSLLIYSQNQIQKRVSITITFQKEKEKGIIHYNRLWAVVILSNVSEICLSLNIFVKIVVLTSTATRSNSIPILYECKPYLNVVCSTINKWDSVAKLPVVHPSYRCEANMHSNSYSGGLLAPPVIKV